MNWGEGSGSDANLIVSNSTISGNSAAFGAGVYNYGATGMATMSVNNSTFSENTAGSSGGGISNDGLNGGVGNLTVSNSTFYKNTAFSGGGIITYASSGGTATVDIGNTILLTGATGSDIDISNSTVTSHGYNLSNQGGAGVLNATGDQINTDPMLGPLNNNGGPTLTHAPLINSPAIDQGKRDAIPALTTNVDQRGSTRPVSDPAVVNFADGSDIGAVELGQFVHPTIAFSRKTHNGAGTRDLGLSLVGIASVEPRSSGAGGAHKIVVNFSPPVSVAGADVTTGVGSVSDLTVTGANRAPRIGVKNVSRPNGLPGNQVIIDLTGVVNGQRIVVALFGVTDGSNTADVGIQMSVLVGDATQNGSVNASDTSQVKSQSGQTVIEDNFVNDVTVNGAINSSDVSLTKSKSGTALP